MYVYISLNLLGTVNCVNSVTVGDLDVKKNKDSFFIYKTTSPGCDIYGSFYHCIKSVYYETKK